jgi:putative transposase
MSYRYQSRRDDSALRERLVALAREKPRYGYRRLHVLLKRHEPDERVNHKRVWRVYRDLGLSVPGRVASDSNACCGRGRS